MNTKIVDDHDPSVNYSGAWGQAGGPNELDGTTTWTHAAGATATLHFSGTGISVFGTIPNTGRGTSPTSTYSVDGSTEGSYTGTLHSDVQYKILFFQSSTLSAGDHTLVVTNTGNSTGLLYLDFFQIIVNSPSTPPPGTTVTVTSTPPPPPPPPPSPSVHSPTPDSSRAASTQSTSMTIASSFMSPTSSFVGASPSTVTVTSPNEPAPSAAVFASPDPISSTSRIGIIVGGVLGCLFILGILTFLFYYFLRNRKTRLLPASNNKPVRQPLLPSAQLTQVTPFDLAARNPVDLLSGIPSQDTLNPFSSKSARSVYTHGSSPSWGGQTHSSVGYPPSSSPSDVAPTARMLPTDVDSGSSSSRRGVLSGIPSMYGTIAVSEAGTIVTHSFADATSSAQSDIFYDPPPRYT